MEKHICIAMVPCPGLSHLIPLVEFAKRLVQQHHKFHVTFLIPTLGPPTLSIKAILNTLPPNMDFTILPQVNMQDLPNNIHLATQMNLTVKHSLPFLHEALSSLSSRTHLVALVSDLFSSDTIDIAKQFNLLYYIFSASGAVSLSFALSLPKLDDSFSSHEFLDLTTSVNIPGCVVPFQVKDLPDPVLFARSSETYQSFLQMCKRLYFIDGVILNSFIDLEKGAIRAVEEIKQGHSPYVFPVGPIIQTESRTSKGNESECIEWLNNQPPKSVLYISFGSGGTLSHDQLREIGFGLEMSGHKFLWVVRVPNQISSSAYFSGEKDNPQEYLPSGFLDRTKGQGLVVPSWAPQVEVLSHGSTGAFLTHCGWSSALEGVVHGVPMIAWPLFAEQRMNAVTLTEVLKVALRPKKDDETGIIKRDEIAKVIKRIMEGDEGLQIRQRIQGFSVAAADAENENGSSKRALASLALKWQNSCVKE